MTAIPLTPQLRTDIPGAILPRLSFMMFLEFAIQGAWLPLLFGFLHNHRGIPDVTVGNILAVGAVGAMLSPLVAGQIADRYMNAERVMALCHFIAAGLVWRIAYATDPNELYLHSFLYGLFLTPTLALVNAISFRHLPDRGRDFGKVRVWGTAGWVCAGIAIGHWLLFKAGNDRVLQYKYMADAMKVAAFLGIALGFYCLTLPATPPAPARRDDELPSDDAVSGLSRDTSGEPHKLNYASGLQRREKLAPAEALKEILRQPLLTLFLLAFPIAALHAFFFARAAEYLTAGRLELAPDSWINKIFGVGGAGLMTVGQISELVVLALMPLIVKRFSRKTLFAVGLSAYALRFFVFAYLPNAPAIIFALALHGIVFGCFFFLVFITIDEYTTKDVRSSAQNVFNLIIFGVGVILGNWFSGWLGHHVTSPDKGLNWQTFYAIPGAITVACLVALLIFYPNRANSAGPAVETAVV